MTEMVWVFAVLTAAVHALVFVWEALLFPRPSVHQGIFAVETADVPAVRLWAFGVGFYNLFIAGCLVAGVVAWMSGAEVAGRALVTAMCVFVVLSSVVLLVADRMAMGRPRGAGVGGALAEGLPPLAALVALATL